MHLRWMKKDRNDGVLVTVKSPMMTEVLKGKVTYFGDT